MDKEKVKEWLAVKKEHLKDYASPYTEKLQPMMDNVKEYTDPLADKVKEKTAPMAEKAREQMAANAEKMKAQSEAKRIERERKAAEKAAEKAANPTPADDGKKKKIIIGAAVALVLAVALVVGLMLGGDSNEVVDDPSISDVGDDVVDENYGPTLGEDEVPPEERILVNENFKPTFVINGNEYRLGCLLSDVLADESIKIAHIEAYLHYSPNALMVPAGKTREWELEDANGKKLTINIYNYSNEELSSEHCQIIKISVANNDKTMPVSFVSDSIRLGMKAKDITEIFGEVSGREDTGDYKVYWWNWKPYTNSNEMFKFTVKADPETGEVVNIKVVLET